MASGIRSTLELILGRQENLFCVNAYTGECKDPMTEFSRILTKYPEDEIVIMTDMLR
jgi:mannose/fructose-specific phosphotransferase system component IIA